MKVRRVKEAPGLADRIFCSNCGRELPLKYYNNEKGVPCYDPNVCEWNYCPTCGDKIEKEGDKIVTE